MKCLTPKRSAVKAKELVELFANGQKAYKQRDWRAAGQAFEQVLDRWAR